jgi:hypothetical protein
MWNEHDGGKNLSQTDPAPNRPPIASGSAFTTIANEGARETSTQGRDEWHQLTQHTKLYDFVSFFTWVAFIGESHYEFIWPFDSAKMLQISNYFSAFLDPSSSFDFSVSI